MLSLSLLSLVQSADVFIASATHAPSPDIAAKWVAIITSSAAATVVGWLKALRPAWRAVHAFVVRLNSAVELVEHELKPNGGGSLRDIVNSTRVDVRAIGSAQALTTAMQRSLAAASRSPMFQTDSDGRCTWVNDTWQRATGVSLDEAQGMGFVNGIHPDDRARVLADWNSAVDDVRAFRCDYRYQHIGTHEETRVRTEAHPIKAPDGAVAGYVGTAVLLDLAGREPFGAYDRRQQTRNPAPLSASTPPR